VAGQNLFESVFTVLGGGNYGWNIREGTHCFDTNNTTQPPETCNVTGYQGEPLIGPIFEGGHDLGNTVVGGQVYRGTMLPDFEGRYVFGYWSFSRTVGDGTLLVATPPSGWNQSANASADALTPEQNQMWTVQEISVVGQANQSVNEFVRSIGEGPDGELYLLTNAIGGPDASTTTGNLWKIVPPTGSATGGTTATTTTAAVMTTTTTAPMETTTTAVGESTPSPAATTNVTAAATTAQGTGYTP
jgi:hypothetical protein